MPLVTILTATYNRAKTLERLFNSLNNQTIYDFEWILIDDGSTDNTQEIIESFNSTNYVIRKYKHSNIGLNQTLNKGIELANGDLIFRVDSDDYITNDAIEKIKKQSIKIINDENTCGIVFLTKFESGQIVGKHPFNNDFETNFFDYRFKYDAVGDRAEVIKREIYLNYPFPRFKDEKFCPEIIMWAKMADNYNAVYINDAIYIREYNNDSITHSGVNASLKNPIGATHRSLVILNRTFRLKYQFIYSIKYFRWALKSDLGFIAILKSVPFYSTLIGFAIGVIIHFIDKINPYLFSNFANAVKNIIKK